MGNAISFRLNPKCESDRKGHSGKGNHRMDGAGNQKHGRGIYQGGAGVLTEYG